MHMMAHEENAFSILAVCLASGTRTAPTLERSLHEHHIAPYQQGLGGEAGA